MSGKQGTKPEIRGWDAESIAEFDRRWLRGDTISEIAYAFRTTRDFVCRIRKRRALPTRCGPDGKYRGSNKGVSRARS